jgi:hypothetical protein
MRPRALVQFRGFLAAMQAGNCQNATKGERGPIAAVRIMRG